MKNYYNLQKNMSVIKRNGTKEAISFDKITKRIQQFCVDLDSNYVDPVSIAKDTISGIYDCIKTEQLDKLAAEITAQKIIDHPDFNKLAARLCISNLHKKTEECFLKVCEELYSNKDVHKKESPLITKRLYDIVKQNHKKINQKIDFERDFFIDFFGFKTLERSYLKRKKGKGNDLTEDKIIERPQHLWMRVSLGIHHEDLDKVFETYDIMSELYGTHATPTLFNSGTPKPQMSSCYLLGLEDSIDGIFDCIKDTAKISKYAGGIGIHVHNIRAQGSLIRGTNGISNGIIPFLQVINQTTKAVNQGGKRPGSAAIYCEPWHADIYDFVDLRKPTGDENKRARDLFLALWIPDLFMKRVLNDEHWSLMCPDECPYLSDKFGDEFEKLYCEYEQKGLYKKQIRAKDLWYHILEAQIETGMPYMSYKDNANNKSNQKNIGTIKSSNLCVAPETQILTDKGHIKIQTLVNKKVNVWNGKQFSEVEVKLTGKEQKLMNVETFDNTQLICTPEHKFYIQEKNIIKIVEAKNLKCGMALINCEYPKINDNLDWFAEYAKDKITKNNNIVFIKDTIENLKVQKLKLQTHGIDSRISPNGLHFTKKHISKLYECLQLEESNGIEELPILIKNVTNLERYDDTYCFTEPLEHRGIFNGIITGQCNEIYQYSDDKEHSICNLASICLPQFIKNGKFKFKKLKKVAYILTQNLNKVIDLNYYPTEKTRLSNMKHRPIGLGVQGLADTYSIMKFSYGSPEAYDLNKRIFETIYYGSLRASIDLAKKEKPYESFNNSPFSKGILQFDMWGLKENDLLMDYDWDTIKEDLRNYGSRNSLLTTCMPTASTSQIMGNNESFEPYTSNLYSRSTSAGDFVVLNKHMVKDLLEINLWTKEIKNEILYDRGSIQNIVEIPQAIRDRYLTAYEMPQKFIVQQCIERGPFIDQSQSMNLFMDTPDFDRLTSSHFYSWKNGLKTGMYYLRGQASTSATSFGLDPLEEQRIKNKRNEQNYYDQSDDDQSNNDQTDDNEEQEDPEPVKACPLRRIGDPYAPCDMCSG